MSVTNLYKIPFVSLKNGIHSYKFEAGETFFSRFEGSIVDNAEIVYDVELERLSTFMNLFITLSGNVNVNCDRCGGMLTQEVEGNFQIVVKFGDENSDLIDDVIVLGPAEHELELDQLFYEFASLCLNQKNVHETESDCDQEALEALKRFELRENDDIDPRWSKLKDL